MAEPIGIRGVPQTSQASKQPDDVARQLNDAAHMFTDARLGSEDRDRDVRRQLA